MIDLKLTDDEFIAQLREKERRARRVVYLIALAPVVGAALVVIGSRAGMGVASWWAMGVACAVVVAGFAWLMWRRPPPEAYGPRIVARRTDEIQRGRARQLWAYLLLMVCFAPQILIGTHYALDRGGPTPLGLPRGIATNSYFLVIAISLLASVVTTWMMLMGLGYPKTIRPVMDDELSRAHRTEAIVSGFLASLIGGTATFAAGLIEPRWAVMGLPFVITGSLAVAAAHFVLLERRADLSG